MTATKLLRSKVCLIGDSAVGKTSTIRRYVIDKFDDKYIVTIGTKLSKKDILYNYPNLKIIQTLLIWDVVGQKEFRRLQSTFYSGAKGVIFVCDITRKETLPTISNWTSAVFKTTGEIPIVITGNKTDLMDNAQITAENIEAVAWEYNAPYFLTSAKTGENVNMVFRAIGEQIIKKMGIIPNDR